MINQPNIVSSQMGISGAIATSRRAVPSGTITRKSSSNNPIRRSINNNIQPAQNEEFIQDFNLPPLALTGIGGVRALKNNKSQQSNYTRKR